MMIRILSVLEDAAVTFAVAFFFLSLALRSAGFDTGTSWAAFWCCVGVAVLASGALLRIGPGTIAKMVKARAAQMTGEQKQ